MLAIEMSLLLLVVLFACTANAIDETTASFQPSNPSTYPHYYIYDHPSTTFKSRHIRLDTKAPTLDAEFRMKPINIPFRAFSQSGQELIVLNILKDLVNGYFIDLAANDWKRLSNTLTLEYYNKWDGVCIEPNPIYFKELLENRRCVLFVNPVTDHAGDQVTYNIRDQMSGIIGEEFDNKYNATEMVERAPYIVKLTTTTLTQILDFVKAPTIIQYLSLDIEGAEYLAMQGLDFSRYTVLVMSVERPKAALHHLLIRRGYVFLFLVSGFGECMYVHHTLANLNEVMQQYKRPNGPVIWNNIEHPYMSHPQWTGNYTNYRPQRQHQP
jgi:hypothetical protein